MTNILLASGLLCLALCCLFQQWQLTKQHRRIEDLEDWKYDVCTPARTEKRCDKCADKETCPGYDTGVIYPCPYFKEDHHGEEG